MRAVFKADAVELRWSNEANQRYQMLASDCFPRDMVEEEWVLVDRACACGNLPSDARTRVMAIRGHDDACMRGCLTAGFETLVSVPVRLQHRLIGEINVFYRSSTSLTSRETELLDALSSHLANALEGLRSAVLDREAAVAEERALIARELHDSIAQSLAFLKIQVQLLRKATNRGEEARVMSTLDELDEGLRESIHDVRELLTHFRARTSTDDIERALKETLQKFQNQTGIVAHLHVDGQGVPLPAKTQVQVLHVLQEALSNVRKHACASHVELDVLKGSHWRFRVRDDGAGFNVLEEHDESHVGMKIMHERAALIGARIDVRSERGQGTAVNLTLPSHRVTGAVAPTHVDLAAT